MARYFLDTSALLPHYLAGAKGYRWVNHLCAPENQNTLALAAITQVELAAALNQLVRGNQLRKKTCDTALTLFRMQVASQTYLLIPITASLLNRAMDLCTIHALKGYDAVQLACGLLWREDARTADDQLIAQGNMPLGEPIFLTEDHRLRSAAQAERFIADSPLDHDSWPP